MGSAPASSIPTIVPGKKIRPVVLVESTRAIIPERRRRTIGAAASAEARAERQGRLDLPRGRGDVVAEAVQRDGRGGHRVADHHAAHRHEVLGRPVRRCPAPGRARVMKPRSRAR